MPRMHTERQRFYPISTIETIEVSNYKHFENLCRVSKIFFHVCFWQYPDKEKPDA